MSVLINKKRCDNADVCPCILECPTKAFYWDATKNSVMVDNNLCVNCQQCVIACEAGAVKVAKTEEEYERIKTEYDQDIMTVEELFQDRYGACIIDEKYSLELDSLDQLIKDSNKALIVEFYNDDEAQCLINSISISEIIDTMNLSVSYRKINVSNIRALGKYEINILPALIVIIDNIIVYKHQGFIDNSQKEKLLNELEENFQRLIFK